MSRLHNRWWIWAALWIVGCADPSRPGGDPARIDPPESLVVAVERLRAFIHEEMEAKGLPALSVVLVDDQTPVWAEGFGWERPADSVPADANTVYRVGSVSKLFTDLAVMQRVERGELDLDGPIQDVLPDLHPQAAEGALITLRQLMSHRSGLVREPPVGHYFDDRGPTLTETVNSLSRTALVLPPQTRTKYSNAGIAAVGFALEERAGEDFAGLLQREVLAPLGMRSSGFEPTEGIRARLAAATMWTLDGREFDAPTFQLGMAPAGSMYATVLDLGRFLSMLFAGGTGPGGRIVEAETLESMWTPQFQPEGTRTGAGLGFFVSELDGRRVVRHGGAIYGFATELAALPDERLGVVVVTSMDIANPVVERIATAALRSALAVRTGADLPELAPTEPLSPERAERLEGRYVDADGVASIDLLERGGRLYLEFVAGGSRVELRERGDTLIADDRTGYGGYFVETGDGIRSRAGSSYRRIAVPEPPAAPERWAGLVGEYGWDHNTLYVLEQDGQLQALIEWFFRYPLLEEASDRFRFPDAGLYDHETLVFERDGQGRATRAILAGSVVFERRALSGEDGSTFRINPLRTAEQLRPEALAAQPPEEVGDFRDPELVELVTLDPTIRLDIRYATTNNFMGERFYEQPRAFLQRPAAEALVRAHQALERHGYGLLVHDGYRPWYVTRMFWDATPPDQRLFVADPSSGSRHNRGAAVDLTLFDRRTGVPVQMVSGYDEFSDRAFPDYPGGTDHQRWLRELLREAMEDEGFQVYEWEWWHFDYGEWRRYPILNQTFDQIPPA